MLFGAEEKGGEYCFHIRSYFSVRFVYGVVFPIVDDRNGRVYLSDSLPDAPYLEFEKSTTFFCVEPASPIDFGEGLGFIAPIEKLQPVDRHA